MINQIQTISDNIAEYGQRGDEYIANSSMSDLKTNKITLASSKNDVIEFLIFGEFLLFR